MLNMWDIDISINHTIYLIILCESESCSVSLKPYGLYSPWNSPGQNTGVGSLSHLQGIFPTQGLNPGLLHCRWILYQLSHKGSPRILEWVAFPFSSGFSQPRSWTGASCIAGGFLTNWAIREAWILNTCLFLSFYYIVISSTWHLKFKRHDHKKK